MRVQSNISSALKNTHIMMEPPIKRQRTTLLGSLSTIVLIVLTILSAIAIYVTGRRTPLLGGPPKLPPPKTCILYDRPPRTGSATMSKALDECLTSKGYGGSKRYQGVKDYKLILRMLDRRSNRTALVSRQVFLTRRSVNLLKAQCVRFLFFTSARPMKERLLSKLKRSLRDKRKKLLGDGGAFTDEQFQEAVQKRTQAIRSTERYYEKLPGLYGGVNVEPNYVVRAASFQSDLSKLLQSFGCSPSFKFTVEDNITELLMPNHLKVIRLTAGDEKYTNLTRIANERNNDTLERIASTLK